MTTPFSISLLQAVSDWQRGGDAKQQSLRARTLKSECAALSAQYRTCQLVCHRQIALVKVGVWDLIGENRLAEKISSWTLDIEVAKKFKGGVPPQGQEFQGVIFSMHPPPYSVVVSLDKLYRDQAFVDAMKNNQDAISSYQEGAGRYGGTQSEVVLEIAEVTQEDIYSLGGYSSALEKLVSQAADLVYQRPSTLAEQQALLLKANGAGMAAGPSWLSMDATRRVLARTKPQAAMLAEIKRRQGRTN